MSMNDLTKRPLEKIASEIHAANRNWWLDEEGNYDPHSRNKGEALALMHSEISEALEGVRKGLRDEHLPQYSMEYVELIDLLIRVFDYLGAFNVSIDTILYDKMVYNASRADHKLEQRAKEGGKKF